MRIVHSLRYSTQKEEKGEGEGEEEEKGEEEEEEQGEEEGPFFNLYNHRND